MTDPPNFQVVSPEDREVRAKFAEITGEDPRSYEAAVEHRRSRTTSPIIRRRLGWSPSSLAKQEGWDTDDADPETED